MLTLRIGRRDRSRPGPARRPPRAPAVGRRRGGAHGGRAVDDPRPHREDRRARPRRRGADVSRDPGRERAPPGRAAAQHSARGCPRAGARSRGGRVQGPQPGRRMSEVLELTAAQAAERVRAGEVSAPELFELYRERARGDELGAFLWVSDAQPPESPPDAPLGGVPLAVKDLFCVEGVPSMAASRILDGYRPPYTSTAVRKLRAAGAAVLGKTNMDEFAMGSSNENSGYGPVQNPWDRSRVPGGSSGGSAAAVAAGLAPWALGTDTGGSIRQPAALCGVVGLKPTYGACSRRGMIAFASSLDQAGPLTRDVTDAALLLSHMVGKDSRDSTSLGLADPIPLPTGYYDAYYGTAQKVRTKISEDFKQAFERFDFVATPTSPWTAFELGAKTSDPLAMYMNDFCTVPMSLAGIPAISIPSGLSEGLPVGFQLAGPAFSESGLLDAAYALERAIGFEGVPR